jgi:hypothetical protein
VSRRSTVILALICSAIATPPNREARAQRAPATVTILRRTPLRTAASPLATILGYLTPSSIEVTQLRMDRGFLRLLRREIDGRGPSRAYGYVAVADVVVDSARSETAAPRADTTKVARADTAAPSAPPARATPAAPTATAAPVAEARSYPLETTAGLRPIDVTVDPTTHAGKRGIRVAIADTTRRRLDQLPPDQQVLVEQLVVVEGTDFANGVIEAEIAGTPGTDAGTGARGFVGIAFRLQPDLKTYDAFYLRPTNGRAEDQERRNHSAQYISHPAWTWNRLRQETPGRYEAYVDLVPDAWTPVRIEVHGAKARLFVNGQTQPTLIVNDVKSGESAHGAIALWMGPGTIAHFRNLRVTPSAR